MEKVDAIVLGAGLAGLVAAFELKRTGRRVIVVEASSRAGGVIRSEKRDGFLLEHGPNTVPPRPEILALIKELGLDDQMITSSGKIPRFIQYQHRLYRVPPKPGQLITWGGFFRALTEPFRSRQNIPDETVWNFANRRFGPQVADRLMAPFVSGIWAGDAKQLSLTAAFPQLYEWEQCHGSAIAGFFKTPRSSHKGLVSFRDGMETLTKSLTVSLSSSLKLKSKIQEFRYNKTSPHWTVVTSTGDWETDTLVSALPSKQLSELIKPISEEGTTALASIPYAPIKVLHLGFRKTDVIHNLAGFGYLVAPSEKSDILGCLWSSSFFAGRAPENMILLTIFMGGSTNPDMAVVSNVVAVSKALQAIEPILGLKNAPVFQSVTSHESGIPQYNVGHNEKRAAIKKLQETHSGLFIVGNYMAGISVNDVIGQAQKSFRA